MIPWRGLARVAAVVLGPPAVYAAGYFVGHATLSPIRGSTPERWGIIPLIGAMGIVGVPVGAWAIAMLARIVFVVSRGWIRSGFREDAERARLRSPDTPGVGALSEAASDDGALSLRGPDDEPRGAP
jgi:hypothetical protein